MTSLQSDDEVHKRPSPAPGEPTEDPDDLERRRRYEETERELLAVLDAGATDDPARKRHLVGLFDRFRTEYTQLSVKLRESLRLQRRLLDKCLQTKNELVVAALQIKTTQQVQADEITNLVFYRDECEHAWKQSALSHERERDAMRVIDELKAKVDELQLQVKTLVVSGAPITAARHRRVVTEDSSELMVPPSPLSSPQSRSISPSKHTIKTPLPGSTGNAMAPAMPSFDEWKAATRVWSPTIPLALGAPPRTAPTPSPASLYAMERQQEIARCVSVPSLQPTPMERVSSPSKAKPEPTQSSPLPRRGGTPAIKRRAPRQLPQVQ
ncbi:hypothetical protein BBJ28_00020787 [Nothophytophthora sp. Chile5]|nr:hypothetical protein BBJ28_00020787 [Nothophytophthora sp. Chile5]